MSTYAGIDIGATYVRAIIGDESGAELAIAKQRTSTEPSGKAVSDGVIATLRSACEEAGIDPSDLHAVGIGSMGPLDREAGAIDHPVNLADGIERVPLTGPISDVVGTDRVYLHNDTATGAIGERYFGNREKDDIIYLTISSGISAGAYVDGNLLEGLHGNAGEAGHLTVDSTGVMTCRCGTPGHWEAYCSGKNIPRYARKLYETEKWDTDLPIESADFSAADVYDHAYRDDFAAHVLDRINHWNVTGIADLVHSFAPEAIYIGGGVALNNPEMVIDPIRESLPDRVYVTVPDIELTSLGDDVVLKGALASALTDGTGKEI